MSNLECKPVEIDVDCLIFSMKYCYLHGDLSGAVMYCEFIRAKLLKMLEE